MYCIPVFIAALFTIARTWKQARYPSAKERIRKVLCIYTMEYYSVIKKNALRKKGCICISSNEVEETRAYYRKSRKSERKTPIQYINAYIWTLERWLTMALYARQQKKHRHKEKNFWTLWEKARVR